MSSLSLDLHQTKNYVVLYPLIEQGGHMPNFDDPDRFNQIVGDFLEGSSFSGASVSPYRDSALPLNDPAQPSPVR